VEKNMSVDREALVAQIPTTDKRALEALAQDNERSLSGEVRLALAHWIGTHQAKQDTPVR
jgi:hypothetical protein